MVLYRTLCGLLVFHGIFQAESLSCYECRDVTEVQVAVPGNRELENDLKQRFVGQDDSACADRKDPSRVPKGSCDLYVLPDKDGYCMSSDVRVRFSYTPPPSSPGKTVPVTVGFRERFRRCAAFPKGTNVTLRCETDSAYVQQTIRDQISSTLPTGSKLTFQMTGPSCICEGDNCNSQLPATEPGYLSGATRMGTVSICLFVMMALNFL